MFQLEEVMEKETYKKAKEILEKFDPARFKKLEVSSRLLFNSVCINPTLRIQYIAQRGFESQQH